MICVLSGLANGLWPHSGRVGPPFCCTLVGRSVLPQGSGDGTSRISVPNGSVPQWLCRQIHPGKCPPFRSDWGDSFPLSHLRGVAAEQFTPTGLGPRLKLPSCCQKQIIAVFHGARGWQYKVKRLRKWSQCSCFFNKVSGLISENWNYP